MLAVGHQYRVTGIRQGWPALYVLTYFLGTAVAEETMYRGYLFQTAERRWGTATATFWTVLLFALWHMQNMTGGVSPRNVYVFTTHILHGYLFTTAYLSRRSLWLAIGLHWAWDTTIIAFYGYDAALMPALLGYSFVPSAYLASSGWFWLSALPTVLVSLALLGFGRPRRAQGPLPQTLPQ